MRLNYTNNYEGENYIDRLESVLSIYLWFPRKPTTSIGYSNLQLFTEQDTFPERCYERSFTTISP